MTRRIGVLLCFVALIFTACQQEPAPQTTVNTVLLPVISTQVADKTSTAETTSTSTSVSDITGSTVSSCGSSTEVTITASTVAATTTTPSTPAFTADPAREMRAAWVSYLELDTVFLSCKTESQVREKLNGILDTFQQFRLNTMYLHVRANSDAYYVSSYFLPAANAKKFIEAGFDPLAYMVTEAHHRNIAVHAWVNPYRIGRNADFAVADTPTFSDSNGRYYYVPSSATAQRLILNGIRELVNNYAIDGIQYDDYFYPTGVLETNTVYGYESTDYAAYQQSGGTLPIADWRRAAVDSLISATYTIVKSKNLTFGVSPAVSADATYKNLYANPKKWLAESGYVDYICPQVYTGFEHGSNPFSKAVEQWLSYPRHSSVKLYIGVASYKAGLLNDTYAKGGTTEWAQNNDILKRSILEIRNRKIPGFALYSYSYLTPDKVVGLSKTNDVSVAKTEMQNLLTVL